MAARVGARALLATAWLASMLTAAINILPASIMPEATTALGVPLGVGGWLVSATMLAPALGSVPVGVLMDRYNTHDVMAVGTLAVVVLSVASWWTAQLGSFWGLVAVRVGIGAGIVTIWIGGTNLVGAAFPESTRATALAVFSTSAPLGYTVGQFVPPLVAEAAGWETNFLIFGFGGGLAFVAFSLVARRTPVGEVGTDPPTPGELRELFANRALWMVCAIGFVGYSLHLLFNSWLPSYLRDAVGMPAATAALLAAAFPAVGIVSRISGGALSDRLFDGKRRPVPLWSFVVALPFVAAVALARGTLPLLVLVALAGYCIQLSFGVIYALARELVSDVTAGSATAMVSSLSFLGAFTAPLVAGSLLEATGAYTAVFGFAGALAVVGALLAYRTPDV
ncbi:MAG: nitrate/nitrite transporter [Haloarculaceae archaeon]